MSKKKTSQTPTTPMDLDLSDEAFSSGVSLGSQDSLEDEDADILEEDEDFVVDDDATLSFEFYSD